MTNPNTSPVAESVVEQVKEALRQKMPDVHVLISDGYYRLAAEQLAVTAIAAMPRPIEDDTPTDAGEGVKCASSACPVCGLNEPHQHNSLDAMELRGRRFPITNDEWLRYVGRIIDPATVNELDMLHKKAVRLATLPSHPTPADTGLVGELVEAEAIAKAIFEADPDVGCTWEDWLSYATKHPSHMQDVEFTRRQARAVAALSKAKDASHG